MLKKIDRDELRIGMYVHDLGVSWRAHAFLLPRFRIDSAATLQAVRACTPTIVIDTDKGLDVAPPPAGRPAPAVATSEPSAAPRIHVSLDEELQVARKLLREARNSVRLTMQDARTGSISTIPHMRELAQRMMESTSRHAGALLSLAGACAAAYRPRERIEASVA
jgi:hypothetical protein